MTRTTPSYSRTTPVDAPTPLPNRLLRLLSEARWLGFAVISVYLTLIFFTFSVQDPGWSHATSVNRASNWGGLIGAWLADLFLYIFGFSAWWFCVALIALVWVSYKQLANRFLLQKTVNPAHRYEPLIRGCGFVLLMLGSSGLEFVRMYTLKAQLPRAPGGVLGELFGGSAQAAFGFNGSTLIMLMLFGLGFSLCFHVSWMAVAEKLGGALEGLAQWAIALYAARQDRKVGQEAAVKR